MYMLLCHIDQQSPFDNYKEQGQLRRLTREAINSNQPPIRVDRLCLLARLNFVRGGSPCHLSGCPFLVSPWGPSGPWPLPLVFQTRPTIMIPGLVTYLYDVDDTACALSAMPSLANVGSFAVGAEIHLILGPPSRMYFIKHTCHPKCFVNQIANFIFTITWYHKISC